MHNCYFDTDRCICEPPFKLLPFPKNCQTREEWTKFVNRRDQNHPWKKWQPNKASRICSKHFEGGKPTDIKPYPTLLAGTHLQSLKKKVVQPRRIIKKKECQPKRKVSKALSTGNLNETKNQEIPVTDITSKYNIRMDHSYAVCCNSCAVSCSCVKNKHQLEELSTKMKTLMKARRRPSFAKKVLKSDNSIKRYTGFPTIAAFNKIFKLLKPTALQMKYWRGTKSLVSSKVLRYFRKCPKKLGPARKTLLRDELLITLIKLRMDLNIEVLADLFDISSSSVSSIIQTWLALLANALKRLIFFPTRDIVLNSLPTSFKAKNCKARIIIDCSEIFIETSRNLQTQALTWSDYKKHNTAKFLVGITPQGHIAFLSDAWGGRTSDKHIVNESGFLDILDFGDEVMADRGFTIKEELLLKNCTLTIPPSAKGQEQMTAEDVSTTKKVANLRIHVERAINRMKTFQILKNTVPISLVPYIDDILCICAAICNMQSPLVQT